MNSRRYASPHRCIVAAVVVAFQIHRGLNINENRRYASSHQSIVVAATIQIQPMLNVNENRRTSVYCSSNIPHPEWVKYQ